MFKKFGIVVLIFLVLTGCGEKKTGETLPQSDSQDNEQFKLYLDDLFVDFLDPSDFTLNLLIKDPEAMGIELEPYQLTFSSVDDVQAWLKTAGEMVETLKSYEDSSLSNQQVLDKYVIIEYLEDTIAMEPYYDYEYGSNVIGMSRSLLGSLPAYLESFTFNNQRDVDYYLHFLEHLPNNIDQYIELEIQRQTRGTGFSQEELEDIVEQYHAIAISAEEDDYFLIAHFDKVLDGLNFVANKEELKLKHAALIKKSLSSTYSKIATAFEAIDGKPATGLVNRPDGKSYYELLLAQSTGKNATVKEIEALIDDKFNETILYLQFLGESTHDKYFENLNAETFGDFASGNDLLKFLETAYVKDYPSISIPNYELRQVDASMADSSSPAFYFTPHVDYASGDKQLIYINGGFDNALYATYAHEGIPGHMYQFTYFMELESMHPIRDLITTSANAEGWANYTEKRSVEYVSDASYQSFYAAYQTITEIAHIKADIGVHYHGWGREELADYFSTLFGELDAEDVDDIYVNLVTNPAVYPTYYLSSLYFESLRSQVEKELDDAFDPIAFHKVVLDAGSASFNIIEKRVNEYLESFK